MHIFRIAYFVMIGVFVLPSFPCSAWESVLGSAQAHAATLKIATLSPDGSVWMEKMREGADEVAEKTAKRVEIKFYPGGVMGDDKAVLRKIRVGQLHGGAFVSGSVGQFFQDSQVYTSLPLKFKSSEEIDHVRSHMDQLITEGLEKGGFVTFGLAGGGFARIMSSVPINTVEDLRKQKVWVPDNDPIALDAVKAFGVTPIPLSIADVRAGLQTGLVNTVTTPPVGAVALQWHTQVKYLTDIPFLYVYAVLSVSKKPFSKLSPEDQATLREVMGRVFREIDRQNRDDNEKALDALRRQGIQFVKPSGEAMKGWNEKSLAVQNQLIQSGKLSREIVDKVEGLLKAYREKK